MSLSRWKGQCDNSANVSTGVSQNRGRSPCQQRPLRLELLIGVVALVFGLEVPDPNLAGVPSPYPRERTLFAANELQGNGQTQGQSDNNADEVATMGKESGAQYRR
jgi:hypothetical protein